MIKTTEVTPNHKSQKVPRKRVRNLIPGMADGRLGSLAIQEEQMTSTSPSADIRVDLFHWWSASDMVLYPKAARLIYHQPKFPAHLNGM